MKLSDVITAVDDSPTEQSSDATCNCNYPAVIYRNGSGHSESCLVQQAWLKKYDPMAEVRKRIKAGQI